MSSDQPAQPSSLSRVLHVYQNILQYQVILLVNSEDPDQTTYLCNLSRAIPVHMHKVPLPGRSPAQPCLDLTAA